MDNNFCGEGLWSLSPHAPKRTFVEDNPFRHIDQRASDIWKKIKTNKSLTCGELENLALFLNSILYRRPEIVRKMRSVAEKGLMEIDNDLPFLEKIQQFVPDLKRNRDLAFTDGLHFSDYAIQKWLSGINDRTVLDDILAGEFYVIRTPSHKPVPLSDRPYVSFTLDDETFRMHPVDPNTILMFWKRSQSSKRALLDLEKIYKLYLNHSISAARRAVVVSNARSCWLILEWFRPKELHLKDFGSGTENKSGKQYDFGESYALAQ